MTPRTGEQPPLDQCELDFGRDAARVVSDLSGIARAGSTLFVSGDEGGSIERLLPDGENWRLATRHPVARFVSLPGGSDGEIDIEALAVDDDWLWVCGSHTRTRPAPREDDSPRRALRRLSEINRPPNRFLLARIPLVAQPDGSVLPVREDRSRRAETIDAGKRSSELMRWIGEDSLLAPFLALPTKENGFDIEGIAVAGESVWLGLRGPTIRGYAVILQLSLRGAKRGLLKARKIEGDRRVRKYLLPLGGLAVRDLLVQGEDLLVLSGGTTHADSPARLYRWQGAVRVRDSQVVPDAELSLLTAFPFAPGTMTPEAIADLGGSRFLILHDRRAKARPARRQGRYTADILTI